MVKTSDLIAQFLKEKGIDTAFGIIGSANSHIFDSIHKLGYTKIINVHNEQSAVMAMGAYYRASNKMSIALVTAGGGTTNAVTGVVSNWADSIPGLIISGQENYNYVASQEHLRMYGTQGLNASKMIKEVTKKAIAFYDGMDIQRTLEELYDLTASGRPGPCWLDIPMNLQAKKVEAREWKNDQPKKFNRIDVEDLINSINKSKRPVIVGGHGIRLSGAKKSFNQLTDYLKIPTLLTWSGIDLLFNDNPNFYGRFGLYGQRAANFIVQNSDLIIILGSRLALPQVGYDFSEFARNAEIYVVDIDPTEANKYDRVKPIVSDVSDVINELMAECYRIWGYKEEWKKYCDDTKAKYPWVDETIHGDNGKVNSYKFIDKISDHLQEDHIVVTDMGTALLSGHQAIKLKKGQTMFTSLGLGEMGYGLPGAIGASLACPNKPVLCLNCDGGMMMNLQEAHTIVENNLPIKIVIFNNDGYLMIKHTQKMLFKGDYTSVDKKTGVGLPNFQNLMSGFGYKYFSLKNADSTDMVLNAFFNFEGPACLEVFMDPEQDFIPKVKGVLKEDGTIFPAPIEEMSPLLSLKEVKQNMISGISEKSKQIQR
jgi:acetolactate synthase-1/2/3 large subunit